MEIGVIFLICIITFIIVVTIFFLDKIKLFWRTILNLDKKLAKSIQKAIRKEENEETYFHSAEISYTIQGSILKSFRCSGETNQEAIDGISKLMKLAREEDED